MRCVVVTVVAVALLTVSCGSQNPVDTIIGEWEIDGSGATLLFTEDGRWEFQAEGSCGTWAISGDDAPILTIYDDDGHLEGSSEAVFEGNDAFSFTMDGRTYSLERIR